MPQATWLVERVSTVRTTRTTTELTAEKELGARPGFDKPARPQQYYTRKASSMAQPDVPKVGNRSWSMAQDDRSDPDSGGHFIQTASAPPAQPPRPPGDPFQDGYDDAFDRYFDRALAYAQSLRLRLGGDVLEEGEAVSIAGEAIWKLADTRLRGEVRASEPAWLFSVIRNMMVRRFADELARIKPQARAERRSRQAMRELEEEIRVAEANGSPISPEKIAQRVEQLERLREDAPHREYFGDDGISPEGGIPDPADSSERIVDALSAKECIDRIFDHSDVSGEGLVGRRAEAARRRKIALTEMLSHAGDPVPGWVWTMYGWTPGYGATLANETRAWIKRQFPELGREFL